MVLQPEITQPEITQPEIEPVQVEPIWEPEQGYDESAIDTTLLAAFQDTGS